MKLPQRFMELEVGDLIDTETFPCLDEVILVKLMTEIGNHMIEVKSVYTEDGQWYQRAFTFSLESTIEPEDNKKKTSTPEDGNRITEVRLLGFRPYYRDEVALSLESLVKKIIEHCLPYFNHGRLSEYCCEG